ncbi:MAG: hypothetical protein LBR49_07315 [Tannerella sp.]|jgi:3-oxoacyl-(acyl-carrier-protein) synthase|nr:hypothetical protein [Tannerella sp.]
MAVYIQSATHISAQQPLCDDWWDRPVMHNERLVMSNDPKFSEYLSPLLSRRMCNLLKRATITARIALSDAHIAMPDAIISGTGLGCIENTEKFLYAIKENGEQCLPPTFFMQSTHNIISSLIAIDLKCHGYNNTYVHRGVAFDHALSDAFLQFRQHGIRTALVGGYDELTSDYHVFLSRTGLWNFTDYGADVTPKQWCFASEVAVSMALCAERDERTMCEINGIETMYRPTPNRMQAALNGLLAQAGCSITDIDAVMVGIDHNPANDAPYHETIAHLLADCPVVQYKHLFGQSFTASALGVYAAAVCLRNGRIPAHLLTNGSETVRPVKRILFYNHHNNKSHTFILLSQCSNS